MGVCQLFSQFRILILQGPDIFRLTQSNAALQGNVLVQLVVQRLLFLKNLNSAGVKIPPVAVVSFKASLPELFRHNAWGLLVHSKKLSRK